MTYPLLPPEINSGRLYTGPGSAPLLTAAQVWDGVSQGLYGAGVSSQAVIADLLTTWTGSSAAAMSAAWARYQAWLTTAAAQAATTAAQAQAAAAAFETARAASVHPALVAANRTQTALLIATNLLGQNTAIIAALEALYAEMWAQDVAAMADYQTASAAATSGLQPFTPPTAMPAASIQTVLGQLADPTTILGQLNQYALSFVSSGPYELPVAVLALFTVLWGITSASGPLSALSTGSPDIDALPATSTPPVIRTPRPNVRATTGAAQRPAALSVPPSWTQPPLTAPERPPTARPLTPGETDVPIPLPMPMPLPITGGTPTKQDRPQPEYGQHSVKFIPQTPAGG